VTHQLWLWIGFNAAVVIMLALDLGVLHRRARKVSLKEAALWSSAWVGLALLFNLAIYFWMGKEPALEFLAGYLIEKSLSIDNIFVFVLLFSYFSVPDQFQHRVLFWGVLGALLMRAALIAAGAALLAKFHWVIYLFGGFLVITGLKMALSRGEPVDPADNVVLRLFRRLMPVSDEYDGARFLTRRNGVLHATPLLMVLVLIEFTDLIFAVDSIPAIFAVTRDPFLVYTSNVFAILGLRALYFLLAAVVGLFRFLKLGLAAVLAFVGVKMLLAEIYPIPITVSLAVVAAVLAVSIVLSLLYPAPKSGEPAH
jgi:tellurite resistance protein TerC